MLFGLPGQRELNDVVAAGIDVCTSGYLGDPGNVAEWSIPDLRVMVQAEQAMAQAGQSAPKIGVFEDTTSLALPTHAPVFPRDLQSQTLWGNRTAPFFVTSAGAWHQDLREDARGHTLPDGRL